MKILILALMLLLTGCGPGEDGMERAMDLRSRVLEAEECSFRAKITADYGSTLQQFTLDCKGDSQGDLRFTVAEPETIAGITGKISGDGGKLVFDDTVLAFGLLTDRQLSPAAAPWIFFRTLREGQLLTASEEGPLLHIRADDSYEEDALRGDFWLDESGQPVRAEFLYRNRRVLCLEISGFTLETP